MPKYRLVKLPLLTVPLSGSGVTESLALDHAPFTRMTPVGTLIMGWVRLAESSPFLGTLCDSALWPHAGDNGSQARTPQSTKRRKCIFPSFRLLDSDGSL